MPTPPLALSNLIDINVTVSPGAVVAPTFNQGLFVGPSAVIPSYGVNPRLRQYPSTTAMLSDGFTSTEPEYIAFFSFVNKSLVRISYIKLSRFTNSCR